MNDQMNGPTGNQDENTYGYPSPQETPGEQSPEMSGAEQVSEQPVQEQTFEQSEPEQPPVTFESVQEGETPQSGDPEPEKKKSKTPAIVAVVAVIAIAVGAVFMFMGGRDDPGVIGGVSRETDPEQYFHLAMQRSGLDAQGSGTMLGQHMDFSAFDLGRFSGRPVEHRLSLSIDEAYDFWGGPSPAMGAHGVLSFLMDETAGNFLLNLDVGLAGLSFNDNQLFISDDIVALSVPELYTRHRYLSVNPDTFIRDWNASEFGAEFPIDPFEVGAAMGLVGGFADMFNFAAMEEFIENYMQQFIDMSDRLMKSGEFLDEGEVTITVGDITYNTAKMGYHIPEEIMNEFINEFMDIYFELLREFMGGFVGMIAQMDGMTADQLWNEMFGVMGDITFPGGVTYFAYIDIETNLVRRMDIVDMTISMNTPWGVEEMTMDMIIEYRGERNVYDIMYSFTTMTDPFGVTSEMEMRIYTPVGGPYVFYMRMVDETANFTLVEMGYAPALSEDNIWLTMKVVNFWSDIDFDLRGSVVSSGNEFAIQDGSMTVLEDGETLLVVSFDYSVRNVSAQEVDIDRDEAVDLFSLDFYQLQMDLAMALVRLGVGMF